MDAGAGRGLPSSVIRGEDLVLPFGGQDVLKDTRTRDLLFSYRLDDGTWSAFEPESRAWVVDMPAGTHLFEVRAMDRDLNVDPTPARHRFRVLLPWYSEPWVVGLLVTALLIAAYAVFRILRAMARERAAVQREQAMVDERRQFVRLASHELRKPLARLAHRAEMLQIAAQDGAQDKLADYGRAIVNDSGHLSRLVETLLEQARVQEGIQLDLNRRDLNALVRAAAEELSAEARGEPPQLTQQADALEVSCDTFYLSLALRNLLDNAHKYGGSVSGIEVTTELMDGLATVTVTDSGPGIPEGDREQIFEPFFRGKTLPEHGGFGLGLSFARDIARAHGGELQLLPGSGNGSSFRLSLPLDPTNKEGAGGSSADHR
jgi:signal transduction histidine kinase